MRHGKEKVPTNVFRPFASDWGRIPKRPATYLQKEKRKLINRPERTIRYAASNIGGSLIAQMTSFLLVFVNYSDVDFSKLH